VGLATEAEIRLLFEDCEDGAVPGLGQAYGLDVLVDDALLELNHVYFEAGSHSELVHVTGDMFRGLMSSADHGEFSKHV
jgi:Ala-tRNA(Pro) deacylase